jgi:serine/threonine protein phosphatase PrpC
MYALRGQRTYQEDSGFAVELGSTLVLGVADGFKKGSYSGAEVSRHVLREGLSFIAQEYEWLERAPEEALREMFSRINKKTEHYIAGSTFSVVYVNRDTLTLTTAVLGDSIVALADKDNALHIYPIDGLTSRDSGLSAAFGDHGNRMYKVRTPSIATHILGSESAVVISSDGMYPVIPANNIAQIERIAQEYVLKAKKGATPRDLAEYATDKLGSPDNVTVGIFVP